MGSYKLQPSHSLNLAYYLNPTLTPINKPFDKGGDFYTPEDKRKSKSEKNKLMVSEANNPFLFTSVNTYEFGGDILFSVNNKLNVTERNFGQYPLYVFCDTETYLLSTNERGTYSSVSVVPNSLFAVSEYFANTTFGIVYISRDGLTLYDGSKSKLLSEAIKDLFSEQRFGKVGVYGKEYTVGLKIDRFSFYRKIKGIVFNHWEEEALIIGEDYNLVYSFKTGLIYKLTERIDFAVEGGEREIYVGVNNEVVEKFRKVNGEFVAVETVCGVVKSFLIGYSKSEKVNPEPDIIAGSYVYGPAKVKFRTRPVYFGADEVKRLQRVIIRGEFFKLKTNTTKPFLSLYGSNDGVSFIKLRSLTLPANRQGLNYKDFDMGLMARATFRCYVVELEAEVEEKSNLKQIDFEVSDHYKNDKMR